MPSLSISFIKSQSFGNINRAPNIAVYTRGRGGQFQTQCMWLKSFEICVVLNMQSVQIFALARFEYGRINSKHFSIIYYNMLHSRWNCSSFVILANWIPLINGRSFNASVMLILISAWCNADGMV